MNKTPAPIEKLPKKYPTEHEYLVEPVVRSLPGCRFELLPGAHVWRGGPLDDQQFKNQSRRTFLCIHSEQSVESAFAMMQSMNSIRANDKTKPKMGMTARVE